MTTEEGAAQASRQEERELSIIRQSAQVLAELVVRIGSHFRRAEVRKRVGRYLQGLLASVERKNGWQMAEELGEANAHGVQRLLEEADWDEEAVRDELRTYVIEQLGKPGGLLVVDETGFVKKGRSLQAWRGSTAELPGDGRIARSGCRDGHSQWGGFQRSCQTRPGWCSQREREARDPGSTSGPGCSCRTRQRRQARGSAGC